MTYPNPSAAVSDTTDRTTPAEMRDTRGTAPTTGMVCSRVLNPLSDSADARCDAEIAVNAIA